MNSVAMTQEYTLPDIGEEVHFIHNNLITFIAIGQDEFAESPLDWGTNGMVYSCGRHHQNYDPERVREELENNPDAVALDVYDHGSYMWGVSGTLDHIPGVEFQWDGVRAAGVWVPNENDLEDAPPLHQTAERRAYMEKRARGAIETYNQYLNGDVYGYSISTFPLQKYPNGQPVVLKKYYYDGIQALEAQSCWQYYGSEGMEQIKEEIKFYMEKYAL